MQKSQYMQKSTSFHGSTTKLAMSAHTPDCQTNVMQYLILEPKTDYGGGEGVF
jgi:hypothetical protein